MPAALPRNPAAAGAAAGLALAILNFGLAYVMSRFIDGGPIAAAELLASANMFVIVLVAVVWAPLFETLLGQMLPLELLRRLDVRIRIFASAALFSAGHVLSGAGIGQGIATFIAGGVFALMYEAFRPAGRVGAYIAAASCHAANNGLLIALSWILS